MPLSERYEGGSHTREGLRRRFSELRLAVRQSMAVDEDNRLSSNPKPNEQELYMGAFQEWLEPQVRDAINEMYKKGYATQSSGFHGEEPELQVVDGLFTLDDETAQKLTAMGVEVLRGADIGLPKNKLITVLRYRAKRPLLPELKERWDAIAAVLPKKSLPRGVRPICDRAEEFRLEYAAHQPSLDEARERYHEYLRNEVNRQDRQPASCR